MARVTLQTIADRVGVSRMTVSNAFSRPDQLSAELRARILAAADELGYAAPDPAARALARGTTGTVGVLLTDSVREAFADEVATSFLGAIADELSPTGLALTLLSTQERDDLVPARDVAMDAAVVYSCNPQSTAIGWLRRRRLPLVLVDQPPVSGTASINVDDLGGARAGAEHLLALGHRRIALVTTGSAAPHGLVERPGADSDSHASRERVRGWTQALAASGLQPRSVRLARNDDDEAAVVARTLLDRPDRPTGVLCFSDTVAYGVVRAAEDLGLHVPEDLSVVGFDDGPLARRLRPQLTTVRQDLQAKGRSAAAAVRALLEAARADEPLPAPTLLLPAELVVRESTAAAPPDAQA